VSSDEDETAQMAKARMARLRARAKGKRPEEENPKEANPREESPGEANPEKTEWSWPPPSEVPPPPKLSRQTSCQASLDDQRWKEVPVEDWPFRVAAEDGYTRMFYY